MSISLKIILVRPRNPQNIGAAARAMANFGFEELALVAPHPPVWEEVRSAVGGEEVLARTELYGSLSAAAADCQLVLGTTCAKNRKPEQPFVLLPEACAYLRQKYVGADLRVGVVFGPEKTGLSNEHLAFCHALLTVPTDDKTPSMNLAQAVAVCCYEFSKFSALKTVAALDSATVPPPLAEVEALLTEFDALLGVAGFNRNVSESSRLARLRRLLLNCAPDAEAFSYLRAIVKKLAANSKSA